MATDREEFLAGDRPTDVLIYLSEDALSNAEALADHGDRVDDGIVLVMDGERARSVFQRATGIDPMAFAQQAMGTDGDVSRDCTSGTCPSDEDGDHAARFVFAFAEEQNEDVGDLYAEGDVIHAYVACPCGERYSDKWLADENPVSET
jgi:hypothetical protein